MGESIIKIQLDELKTIRVLCQGKDGTSCPGIVELPIERVPERYRDQKCPLCGASIPGTSPNQLELLAQAITSLSAQKSLKLEFVISQPE